MRFCLKIVYLLIIICSLHFACAFGWTEPVEIDGDLPLGAPRVVAVGESLYVVGVNPPWAWLLRSEDNGATWSEPMMPWDTAMVLITPDLQYSNGWLHLVWTDWSFYPQLYYSKSSDGGRTWWLPRSVFVNSDSRANIYPKLATNGDTLFLACALDDEYLIFRSFNRGQTWQDSTIIDQGQYEIAQHPELLYSNGILHFIYPLGIDTLGFEIFYKRSTDLGLTWSEMMMLSPEEENDGQVSSAAADSAGHILVTWMDYANGSMCGISGDIFYRISIDNGVTWQMVGSITNTQSGWHSFGLILGDIFHVVWDDYWLLGCTHPKEAYSTTADSGLTWGMPVFITGQQALSEVGPALVNTITASDTILHCFYNAHNDNNPGGLFYIRSQGFVEVSEDSSPINNEIDLVAFPNPFNSRTTFSFSLPNFEGNLQICNIQGQIVRKLELFGRQGKIVWDSQNEKGGDVTSGTYYATLKSGGLQKTIQITLVR